MKCEKCGKLFSSQPSLSRKDNKTPICPKCGFKEALEAASLPEDIIKEMEMAFDEAYKKYKI